jgi:hypothetical protein
MEVTLRTNANDPRLAFCNIRQLDATSYKCELQVRSNGFVLERLFWSLSRSAARIPRRWTCESRGEGVRRGARERPGTSDHRGAVERCDSRNGVVPELRGRRNPGMESGAEAFSRPAVSNRDPGISSILVASAGLSWIPRIPTYRTDNWDEAMGSRLTGAAPDAVRFARAPRVGARERRTLSGLYRSHWGLE